MGNLSAATFAALPQLALYFRSPIEWMGWVGGLLSTNWIEWHRTFEPRVFRPTAKGVYTERAVLIPNPLRAQSNGRNALEIASINDWLGPVKRCSTVMEIAIAAINCSFILNAGAGHRTIKQMSSIRCIWWIRWLSPDRRAVSTAARVKWRFNCT